MATTFSRARNEEQRGERREAILATAATMLRDIRVSELTLNELARRVGLAKSNVLRYFESREAVLLELYAREYAAWLDELEKSVTADASIDQRADAVARTAASRPVFCDLTSSAPGVLEHNVSATVAAGYKRASVASAHRVVDLLWPTATDEQFTVLAGGVNIIIGGVWAMSQPSPGMRKAYAENPDLRAMRLDLTSSIRELMATLLTGLAHRV